MINAALVKRLAIAVRRAFDDAVGIYTRTHSARNRVGISGDNCGPSGESQRRDITDEESPLRLQLKMW